MRALKALFKVRPFLKQEVPCFHTPPVQVFVFLIKVQREYQLMLMQRAQGILASGASLPSEEKEHKLRCVPR